MHRTRHLNIFLLAAVYCLALPIISASIKNIPDFPDFPGQYCKARRQCCNSREDSCAMPISDTLCYCDQFCHENRTSVDCCPDYKSYCLNEPDTTISCLYNGKYYKPFSSFKENCNLCKCTDKGLTQCETDVCLIDKDLIDNINSISHYLGWDARNYTEFWGRKFTEGLQLRLGTLEPTYKVRAMTELIHKADSLPRNFNSLDHWKDILSTEIIDQGWCGSSWVISTTSVASDRFAVQSKGKEIVQLSPQQIMSCSRKTRGCHGGRLDVAFRFLNKNGVVDEDCFPYLASNTHCPSALRRTRLLGKAQCRLPTNVDRTSYYTTGPAYTLNNETSIMVEILQSGPVVATMRVYRDFFTYSGGIYKHSAASRNDKYGFHSVRLLGWGEEYVDGRIVKYWTAANSWGSWWGENGFFRILRGANECLIEDYVLAAWPHLYDSIKGRKID